MKKIAGIVLAGAVALAALWHFFVVRGAAAPPAFASERAPIEPPGVQRDRERSALRPASARPHAPDLSAEKRARPLPAREMPLHDIMAELADLAANGNVRAACRLAAEMSRCRDIPKLRVQAAELRAEGARMAEGSAELRRNVAWQRDVTDLADAAARACAGISAADTKDAWRYLLAAAEGGHTPSMTRFVAAPPLDASNFMLDMEGWQAYWKSAPRLLEAAVGRGDPRALYLYAVGLRGWSLTPGGGLNLPRDPERSAGAQLALIEIANDASKPGLRRQLDTLAVEIGPAGMTRARAAAAQLLPAFPVRGEVSLQGGITFGDAVDECAQ